MNKRLNLENIYSWGNYVDPYVYDGNAYRFYAQVGFSEVGALESWWENGEIREDAKIFFDAMSQIDGEVGGWTFEFISLIGGGIVDLIGCIPLDDLYIDYGDDVITISLADLPGKEINFYFWFSASLYHCILLFPVHILQVRQKR